MINYDHRLLHPQDCDSFPTRTNTHSSHSDHTLHEFIISALQTDVTRDEMWSVTRGPGHENEIEMKRATEGALIR